MASVTEDSLQTMAKDIVNASKTKEASDTSNSLTVLTKSAIENNGLNREQGSRLIERVNTTAFLDSFPAKIAFEVADPYTIFGEQRPSDGDVTKTANTQLEEPLEKVSSIVSSIGSISRYSKNFEDYLFTDTNGVKVASHATEYDKLTSKDKAVEFATARVVEDHFNIEKTAKEVLVEDGMAEIWGMFKQAALSGTPTDKLESEILFAVPQDYGFTSIVTETMMNKLASETCYNRRLIKRANLAELDLNRIRLDTALSTKVKEIYSNAYTN